jgi:hypothetical protein
MSIILVGSSAPGGASSWSGNGGEVDADNHLLGNLRSFAKGAQGSFQRVTAVPGGPTGFAATLPASQPLFAAQWVDATRLCVIQSIKVGAMCTTQPSGTISFQFDVAAYVLRGYTVPFSGSATTSLMPFGLDNQQLRTNMGQSLWGDMRYLASTPAAATAGVGWSSGVYAQDAQPLARVQGGATLNNAATAVGVQFLGGLANLYTRDNLDHYPPVLAQNEGLLITNPLAGPGSGAAFKMLVVLEWGELPAY